MDSQIDEIKSRVDIISLASEYLTLTKKGKNYWANCPFHGEKTPSFALSQERQMFKCFGCGVGGDSFTFLEKIEGVSFGQAVQTLAKRAGVTLESKNPHEAEIDQKKETILQINQKATEFYHYLLIKHPAGKMALEYLKNRGVNLNSIKEFKLGFAPNDWEILTTFLLKKGFKQKDLIDSGLSIASDRGKAPYDRFRNRVMFPVFNLNGAEIGFSGRILGQGEPKYLNSPDTLIFNKSNCVYGLHQGRSILKQENLAILVEGNLDVISSHQVGVKNVFAPLGTSLTSSQLGIVRRFTDRIAFCFDSDSAGVSATKRSIELAENQDFNVKIIPLPSGKDPDECIRENPDSWKESVAAPIDIYDYILTTLFKKHDTNTAEGKKKVVAEFLPYLSKIKNEITLNFYKEKIITGLSLEPNILDRFLGKKVIRPTTQEVKTPNPAPIIKKKSRQALLEEYMLALLIQSERYFPEVEKINFEQPNLHELITYLKDAADKDSKLKTSKLGNLPQNLKEDFDNLSLLEVGEDVLEDKDKLEKEVANTLQQLQNLMIRNKLERISVAIKQAEITKDQQKLIELRKQFQETSANLAGVSAE